MKNEAEGKRAEAMFSLIGDKTNFAALIERPEWDEIQRKIVFALTNHDRLKARVELLENYLRANGVLPEFLEERA